MKKFSLYTFLVAFCTVLFLSCDKAAEENTAGYSTFYLSMPTFTSAGGEKTHWDSQGLWWDTEGEIVKINGIQHQILYDNGRWMTTSTVDTTFAVNNSYYICYMGKSTQDAGWDPNNKVYTNVNLTGIVPLVGEGKTNFITLKPCCAVLMIEFPDGYDDIELEVTFTNQVPKTADIYPASQVIEAKSSTDKVSATTDENSIAYIVVPMEGESFETKMTIKRKDNDATSRQTPENVTLSRGVVYKLKAVNIGGLITEEE